MFTSLAIWLSGGGQQITTGRLLLAVLPQFGRKNDPQAEQSSEGYTAENYFHTHLLVSLRLMRAGTSPAPCLFSAKHYPGGVLRACYADVNFVLHITTQQNRPRD